MPSYFFAISRQSADPASSFIVRTFSRAFSQVSPASTSRLRSLSPSRDFRAASAWAPASSPLKVSAARRRVTAPAQGSPRLTSSAALASIAAPRSSIHCSVAAAALRSASSSPLAARSPSRDLRAPAHSPFSRNLRAASSFFVSAAGGWERLRRRSISPSGMDEGRPIQETLPSGSTRTMVGKFSVPKVSTLSPLSTRIGKRQPVSRTKRSTRGRSSLVTARTSSPLSRFRSAISLRRATTALQSADQVRKTS